MGQPRLAATWSRHRRSGGILKRLVAAATLALALGACQSVLGFEDHEPFPPDASGTGGGSSGSGGVNEGGTDAPSDAPPSDASGGTAGTAGTAGTGGLDAAPDSPPPPRVTDGLLVLYTFEEGTGSAVNDVSGVGTPLNLSIRSTAVTEWIPGALRVQGNTVVESLAPATKITDACKASDAVSLEAWVRAGIANQPIPPTTPPARVVTLSDPVEATALRNVTLGQEADFLVMRTRTTTTNTNGSPGVFTPPATFPTALTHILYTRASGGATRIYVNGVVEYQGSHSGTLSNWDSTFELALANEHSADRAWLGDLHLVAFYDRALSQAEVGQNFAAGAD